MAFEVVATELLLTTDEEPTGPTGVDFETEALDETPVVTGTEVALDVVPTLVTGLDVVPTELVPTTDEEPTGPTGVDLETEALTEDELLETEPVLAALLEVALPVLATLDELTLPVLTMVLVVPTLDLEVVVTGTGVTVLVETTLEVPVTGPTDTADELETTVPLPDLRPETEQESAKVSPQTLL